MGYQLFRILATYTGKSKKTKKAFDENLLDPGMLRTAVRCLSVSSDVMYTLTVADSQYILRYKINKND